MSARVTDLYHRDYSTWLENLYEPDVDELVKEWKRQAQEKQEDKGRVW